MYMVLLLNKYTYQLKYNLEITNKQKSSSAHVGRVKLNLTQCFQNFYYRKKYSSVQYWNFGFYLIK